MNILDKIVINKKLEIQAAKNSVSIAQLEAADFFKRDTYSFRDFLLAPDRTGIIAEFKRKSPSKGIINDRVSVKEVTNAYAAAGASALSVLTDKDFFMGAQPDLIEARNANTIPVLRKDFMIDEYQVIEAKAWGADIILLIAAFLRFYQLTTIAPSLTWDEVAWGYNAYSLGIDGRDEFGKFLPYQYLESFGDFKPPMYAYLDLLPIKFLGLNEFAVRFPSALFGVLTILMTFFLVKRIFGDKHELVALLSALFLAISPWHIMLSRAAFEANVATFFIVFGVWAFLAGVQNHKWYILFSAIGLSFVPIKRKP